jgi:hypothetical protein
MMDKAGAEAGGAHPASLPPWLPTPESLGRLGMAAFGLVRSQPLAGEARAQVRSALERGFQAAFQAGGRDPFAPAWNPSENAVLHLPETVQKRGDRLVLLTPELDFEPRARLGRLLQQVAEKNFLRSARWAEPTTLAQAVVRSVAASGLGCRVLLSEAVLEGFDLAELYPAAVVTCSPGAQVALIHFVERRTGFRAESLGQVLAEALFECPEPDLGQDHDQVKPPGTAAMPSGPHPTDIAE